MSALKRRLKRLLGRAEPEPMDIAQSVDYYDVLFRTEGAYAVPYWQSHYYFLWCAIAERLRCARVQNVLDIGCGPGQLASCLFDLAGIESYTGLDFSPRAVEMAAAVCPKGRFVVGDAITTTIHQEVAHDAVICTETLEHVPEDGAVLSRFTSGKMCILTVPSFPYVSHVRHFTNAQEVQERYGPYFGSMDVLEFRGHRGHEVYYLCQGRRNSFVG